LRTPLVRVQSNQRDGFSANLLFELGLSGNTLKGRPRSILNHLKQDGNIQKAPRSSVSRIRSTFNKAGTYSSPWYPCSTLNLSSRLSDTRDSIMCKPFLEERGKMLSIISIHVYYQLHAHFRKDGKKFKKVELQEKFY